MNSKILGSKVKGFTLIEMLVVITIIAILAGISSIIINGFQRDARIETGNNNAKMLHTGMQNQVIQCEIKQDNELFNADPALNDEMIYSRIFFRMEATQIDDVIAVSSTYKNTAGDKINYATRGNAVTGEWFNQLEKAILSMVDSSFEGFCAVYIDFENYTVDSALCFELVYANDLDLGKYDDINAFFTDINSYVPATYWAGEDNRKQFRMLISSQGQKNCVDKKGVYFGAYTTIDAMVD